MSDALALLSSPDAQGIRTLTLNRPDKANALGADLVDDCLARLDEIGGDAGKETRVLVITGAGRNFCAGFDFTGHETQSEGDLLLRFVRIDELLSRLRRLPCLTVARVNGAAFGAGADIACACMLRFGGERTRFRFPGFQFGVALGTRRLTQLIGAGRARAILALNEEIAAKDAELCGLLDAVIEDSEAEARINAFAESSRGLDRESMARLLEITELGSCDTDLADLVRSVSRSGIHARIARYRTPAA
jgi:enoyl-CoA hydratase/carnithine racemase